MSPRAARLLALLTTAYALAVIDRSLLSYMAEPLRRALKLDDVQLGLLQGAAFSAAYGVLALPAGWLVDRAPRRWLLGGGLAAWSLATLAFGLARSFPALVAARACVGVGEAVLHPAAFSLLGDASPARRRPLVMSLYALGPVAGSVAAAGLAASAGAVGLDRIFALGPLGAVEGWRAPFLVAGAPGLLLAVALAFTPEPARGAQDAPSGSADGAWAFLRRHAGLYVALLSGFGLVTLFSFAVNAWTPAFLQRAFGWSLQRVGGWSAAQAAASGLLGAAAGALLPGFLARRGARDAAPRACAFAILAAAGPALLAFSAARGESAFGWLFLMHALLTVPFALAPAVLQQATPPNLRGRVSGLFLVVNNVIGISAGPLLVAVVARTAGAGAQGLRAGLAVTAAGSASLAAAALFAGLRPFRARAASD